MKSSVGPEAQIETPMAPIQHSRRYKVDVLDADGDTVTLFLQFVGILYNECYAQAEGTILPVKPEHYRKTTSHNVKDNQHGNFQVFNDNLDIETDSSEGEIYQQQL